MTNEAIAASEVLTLSERLKAAYERVSPQLRPKAREEFCRVHGMTDQTFRAKRAGMVGYAVTEQEIQWMEDYSPYKK